jgi:hypothetical protein
MPDPSNVAESPNPLTHTGFGICIGGCMGTGKVLPKPKPVRSPDG